MSPEFFTERAAWVVHQGIVVAGAFDDARLDAAGSIGDLVGGDSLQRQPPQHRGIPAIARRQQHPRRQDRLAGQREAQLARLLIVDRGGRGRFASIEPVAAE